MKATLITRFRSIDEHGSIIEMVIWRVPKPVPPTTHGYKYRLVYIKDGRRRIIGFDNERGKGDHMHMGTNELPYIFSNLDQLIEDFITEIEYIKEIS